VKEIRRRDCSRILEEGMVSEPWCSLRTKVSELVEEHEPNKPRRAPKKPEWLTTEVNRALRKNRRLLKKTHNKCKEEFGSWQKEKIKNTEPFIQCILERQNQKQDDSGMGAEGQRWKPGQQQRRDGWYTEWLCR
jgi:hypothetical protein